jgi:hypothetical protein
MTQLLLMLVIAGGVVLSGCSKSEPPTATSSTASSKSAAEAIRHDAGLAETAGGFATGIGLCIQNFCAKKCVPYCRSKS